VRVARLALALAGGAASLPGTGHAQRFSDSALAAAVRLVSEGQGDSARALVRARLAALPVSDSVYPEALFAQGVVAERLDSALSTFRRVSIEFSQSAWADDALLRTAQLSFAARDLATARRATDRILVDYPFSDVRGAAAYWAARVRLEEGQAEDACGFLRRAADEAGGDIELTNRVRYYLQRCRAAPAPADTTVARPPAPTTPRVVYAVQVAAVGTAAAADQVMRDLAGAGFRPRVVREADGLFKVRVGEFPTRAEAQALQGEVRGKVGGQPFVVEERR
jgi:tetratricopeptide (TPR) repeat protein